MAIWQPTLRRIPRETLVEHCSCPPNDSFMCIIPLPSPRSFLTRPLRTQSVCEACPSGTYTDSLHEVCNPCRAGYECLDPTLGEVLCDDGFFSTGGNSECTLCQAGYFCMSPTSTQQACGLGTYSIR